MLASICMDMPFHQQQLEFVIWVAQQRTSGLSAFFRFLNYFDTIYFYLAIILLIWFGISYRWGLRIFYLLLVNSILNQACKFLVAWPRPCHDLPEVGMFQFKDYGFPSGAAQGCMLLGGLLIVQWKNLTGNRFPVGGWLIGSIYIFFVSFSRLYLGVHYPTDILGGWTLGLCLLALFVKGIKPLEKFLKEPDLYFSLLLSLALPLLFYFVVPLESLRPLYIAAMGIGIGAFLTYKYNLFMGDPRDFPERVLHIAYAVATVFLIYLFWPEMGPRSLEYFVLALWISVGAPFFYKSITQGFHRK